MRSDGSSGAAVTNVQNRRPIILKLNDDVIRKFWALVDVGDSAECWDWQNNPDSHGYGTFYSGGNREKAHRFAYRVWAKRTELSSEILIRHSCDRPICCNPNHLSEGSVLENNQDKGKRGRSHFHRKKTCKNGHPYSPLPHKFRLDGKPNRYCRICKAQSTKESDLRRKAAGLR